MLHKLQKDRVKCLFLKPLVLFIDIETIHS